MSLHSASVQGSNVLCGSTAQSGASVYMKMHINYRHLKNTQCMPRSMECGPISIYSAVHIGNKHCRLFSFKAKVAVWPENKCSHTW